MPTYALYCLTAHHSRFLPSNRSLTKQLASYTADRMFIRPNEMGRLPTEPENMYLTPATCRTQAFHSDAGSTHPPADSSVPSQAMHLSDPGWLHGAGARTASSGA